jgi:catechol 2,3-dioxygenase-like lactoylglutathione lyase family enzyme
MIEYQRLFHTGIRVPDLDAAMAELGETLGLTWAESREVDAMPVWTPATGMQSVPLRYVYSCEGPQHVELLESTPGSPWYGGDAPGVHHVGIWVDDVAAEVASVIERGWTVALAGAAPEDGCGSFAYVQPPNGTLVELVNDDILPMFEQWWAAGLA